MFYFATLPSLWIVIPAIGVVIGGIAWAIKKIFKLGQFHHRFTALEKAVDEEIKPALETLKKTIEDVGKDLGNRIDNLMLNNTSDKVTVSKSPRQLNDSGKRILTQSGIGEIVNSKFDALVDRVKAQKPQNAYQGEELILSAVEGLRSESELKNKIEDGAYKSGDSVETVLFVGGIYIRDKILEKLDLKPEDIDTTKPKDPKN